ncbi:SRPBCC family protein [Streptomyces sp. NBC_00083]|uniref:SRPBCC family protein n=1 Tax=Streptomyces sp. NBC_00083 TaxID=2975647 RepID=UPI0022549B25|nr:SRPBCC family protein [Streptomyces sp. NBC_00083]MCX5387101.1 SRPBCC family protein [Streptomyces sp. NBC_00083]
MAESKNPLVNNPAADRLKSELQSYLLAKGESLLVGVGHKLGESTGKLNDIAEGRSPGFAKLALDGGRKIAEGKSPVRTAVELGASHLKENAKEMFKGLGGRKKGGAGRKPTVIMESVDVGVPVRDAYDQWTQFQSFSSFAKGVKSATVADDTTSDWKVKVFWSSRSWKAHTTEQLPDARIAWTTEGAKGTVKGVVTFHPLGENLTRVLLVMEYYPKGLFEKTGNIWRAQGRRARLDLKNFARHISMLGEADGGWRGEIRDGEVVVSHDDAVAEEEEERDAQESGSREDRDEDDPEQDEEGADEPENEAEADPDELEEEEAEGEPVQEYDEDEADPDAEADDGAYEGEYEDEDEAPAEDEEPVEGEYEDEDEVEDEGAADEEAEEEADDPEEASSARKRRAYAGSRSRR